MGNFPAMASTFARISLIAVSFFTSLTTVAIQCPIMRISDSFMPREVTAGVPIRRPLVMNGLLVSFGIVFLFTVMRCLAECGLRLETGDPLCGQVEEHQVVVGTAGYEPEAVCHQGLCRGPLRS